MGGVDSNIPTKKFTFTMKGDFGSPSFDDDESQNSSRRASYLQADGRDMTDVWVLDYVDGVLVQQVHQEDNTAEDFGKPVMQLAYGSHHVYFIASRGTNPTLNTTGGTVTWERPSDTFYICFLFPWQRRGRCPLPLRTNCTRCREQSSVCASLR